MNKKEFATLTIGIKSAYPASKILEDNASMDFWFSMLNDIPYVVAENAVMEYICTCVYPPNIAEIRKLCSGRMEKKLLSADEAWGRVQGAIQKYGFYNPEYAFNMLDDMTLSIVKNLGWSNLCMSENTTADRANFRMAYEARVNEVQNEMVLPKFIRNRKNQLIRQYAPQIEQSHDTIKIEQKVANDNYQLSEKQIADRARTIENMKRGFISDKG